jgi:hypothetical protein
MSKFFLDMKLSLRALKARSRKKYYQGQNLLVNFLNPENRTKKEGRSEYQWISPAFWKVYSNINDLNDQFHL